LQTNKLNMPLKKKVAVEEPVEDISIVPEPEEQHHVETKEVKVIERIFETKEIAPQDVFGKLTRDQINLIKQTVAKGASDDELKLFIQVCKGANLNPFLKQVHLIPRWNSKTGKEERTIQVAIDGFRTIAEDTGNYAGNEDPTFSEETEIEYSSGKEKHGVKVPLSATVTVYKIVHGGRYPFTATARWSEYYPGEKMGFQWHNRPYLMLGKCAEALALRKAFPKSLSGMYIEEELSKNSIPEQAQSNEQTAVETVKKAISKFTMEQVDDFNEKMAKSVKYSDEQKKEFKKLVDARMREITGEEV